MHIRQTSPDAFTVWGPDRMAYASRDIEEGDIVEIAPAIPIAYRGRRTTLYRSHGYVMFYAWGGGEHDPYAKAAGMGTLAGYGFSEDQPNTQVTADFQTRMLVARALRKIKKGEHLTRRGDFEGFPDNTEPLPRIDLPDDLDVNPIQVANTQFGKGIVATRPIRKGEIIEECAVIPVHPSDRIQIGKSGLMDYVFWWGSDRRGTRFLPNAVALGYGGIYNHSSTPNIDHIPDTISITDDEHELHTDATNLFEQNTKQFIALQDIEQGDELFHDYGWGKNDPRFD